MYRLCLVFLMCCILGCMVEGCHTTLVRVETIPPGSVVHFDYKPVGKTPVEFEVDWHGKHKLTLDHPEYGRRVEYLDLDSPAYLYFPLDLFAALMPFNATDRHTFSFDMTPNTMSGTEAETNESTEQQEP